MDKSINPHKPLNMPAGDLSLINQLHKVKVKYFIAYDGSLIYCIYIANLFAHLSLFVTFIKAF